jgi:hypothetical protein
MRASIVAAFLLLLPLTALSATALAATTNLATSAATDLQLAQIIVQDSTGQPMTGALVQVLVVPQDLAASDQAVEPVVGTGTIDAQGHVSTSLTPPALTDTTLVSNVGYVNYELQVTDYQGNLLADYYFARYYGTNPAIADELPPLSTTVLTSPTLASTLSGTPPNWGCCPCSWRTVSQTDAFTVVGELHVVSDLSGTFTYATTANTTIGVAFSSNGGSSWSLSGDVSITNSISASASLKESGNWGHQLKSEFHYVKERQWCPYAWTSNYRVLATDWDGGYQIGLDESGWDNHPNKYTSPYPAGSSFTRNNGSGFNYGGAVCVFGACLNAKTDFTRTITLSWTNTSTSTTRYLYGNDGFPTKSTIIYASLNS